MTDEELKQEVKNGLGRVASASATLASIAPTHETVATAGVMNTLNAIANRPDESNKQEKSPEETALEEVKKATKGSLNIAGLVNAAEKTAETMGKVDKDLAKSEQEKFKSKNDARDHSKGKDELQKGEIQKDPKDGKKPDEKKKEEEKKEDKKKTSSQKYEEEMKKRYSRIDLPSGMYIKAEGQSWNLYDKNNNCMDVTSQMNQLIAYNKGVDEANRAQDVKAGKMKVDENDLPIRDNQLKGAMVDSNVDKISAGDLQPGKDSFDLKKLDTPDMKKLAEITVDRAFDENNLKLLRELEEKKKENENKKGKDKDEKDNVGARSSDPETTQTILAAKELTR